MAKDMCGIMDTRGYFHIRRSGVGVGLAPKFASEIRVGAPNFASRNIGDKYPKFCPLKFIYNAKCPQNCHSFPTFGNRTSHVFPLNWWTWLDFAPNSASKLDVRSKLHPPPPPPVLLMWNYPLGLRTISGLGRKLSFLTMPYLYFKSYFL